MKTLSLRLSGLVLAMVPMLAAAQKNIVSAFDDIINCKQAEITENIAFSKNPGTNVKTGECSEYWFTLPADKKKLIDNVISAYDKDNHNAYSFEKGTTTKKSGSQTLAVGDGTSGGVVVTEPGNKYLIALFLAPKSEDPDGIYRYGYAINYREEHGKITGKLVISYATTLMYRQGQTGKKQSDYNFYYNYPSSSSSSTTSSTSSTSKSTSISSSSTPSRRVTVINSSDDQDDSWFVNIMAYVQAMQTGNSQTRVAIAAKMYKLIEGLKGRTDVSAADRETVSQVLKSLLEDKRYDEPLVKNLLTQSLALLKK